MYEEILCVNLCIVFSAHFILFDVRTVPKEAMEARKNERMPFVVRSATAIIVQMYPFHMADLFASFQCRRSDDISKDDYHIIPWEIIALLFHRRRQHNFYAYVFCAISPSEPSRITIHVIGIRLYAFMCVRTPNREKLHTHTTKQKNIHARKFTGIQQCLHLAHTLAWLISHSHPILDHQH